MPKDGFDGQVTITPNFDNLYDDFTQLKGDVFTYLRKEERSSVLFHELSENYERTTLGQLFDPAHENAKTNEGKLPNGHKAKGHKPGESTFIKGAQLKR